MDTQEGPIMVMARTAPLLFVHPIRLEPVATVQARATKRIAVSVPAITEHTSGMVSVVPLSFAPIAVVGTLVYLPATPIALTTVNATWLI